MNFLAFAGFRAFLYGVVSAYIAQTFGLRTLGRVTGCVFTCGALVNLAQVGGNTPVQYAPYETSTYRIIRILEYMKHARMVSFNTWLFIRGVVNGRVLNKRFHPACA